MQTVNPLGVPRVNVKRRRAVKFYTLGCKVNQYDTQSIRERFLKSGFREAGDSEKAGYCVINTCTVTQSADQKSRNIIRRCIKNNPLSEVIVTGCLVEKDSGFLSKIKGVSFIVSKRFFPDGISNFCGHTRAFLKIQDGCDNFCSYCKVPLVRGRSRSRPLKIILEEARQLVKKGFKEIVLTGICLGAYGRDLVPKIDLVCLIEALEQVEGLFRIRLSSIEAGDVSGALIDKMANSKKLCRHLHIPIQSGDSHILKKMNRKYNREDYLNLAKRLKAKVPAIAITTDVMVGFPGETEKHFKNTVGLIKEIIPLKVHIFPYSKRTGTPFGGEIDMVSPLIVKDRILRIDDLSRVLALKYRQKFLHKKMDVLIENQSREDRYLWQGFTDNYLKVTVRSRLNLGNKIIPLKIE